MQRKTNNNEAGVCEHQGTKNLRICSTVRELFISHLIQLSWKQCILALRIFGDCSSDYRHSSNLLQQQQSEYNSYACTFVQVSAANEQWGIFGKSFGSRMKKIVAPNCKPFVGRLK